MQEVVLQRPRHQTNALQQQYSDAVLRGRKAPVSNPQHPVPSDNVEGISSGVRAIVLFGELKRVYVGPVHPSGVSVWSREARFV